MFSAPGVKFADSDIKFDIRKNQLKHDSGIKPQSLAVLQGVFDGNVQVTANAKNVHLSKFWNKTGDNILKMP